MAAIDTILYCDGQEEGAKALAASLKLPPPLCAMSLMAEAKLVWERFPSKDPNFKLLIDAVKDKNVVLMMNQDDGANLVDQLQLLLFLQRFLLPDALDDQAKDKWKRTVREGKYTVCSAASISVIIPWYRYCQMERTCRWTPQDGKWSNSKGSGEYVDVPTALTFASLLSAAPSEGPPPGGAPPKRLLLVDMHEYEDLERVLDASGAWSNERTPYDFVHGTGTYFASGFDAFLSTVLLPKLASSTSGVGSAIVVFPDHGAHRRFYKMVHTAVQGIPLENICWIDKSRVGAEVTQAERLSYLDASGNPVERPGKLTSGCEVLIADDFTNSGSTLFGGAKIIRKLADGPITVSAYVSHFVAKYDAKTVTGFTSKLYGDDAEPALDYFYTTDSIPMVIGWLEEELAKRPERKAMVMPLAPLYASWLSSGGPTVAPTSLAARGVLLGPLVASSTAEGRESLEAASKWLGQMLGESELAEFEGSLSSAVNQAIKKPKGTPLKERLEMVAQQLQAQAANM